VFEERYPKVVHPPRPLKSCVQEEPMITVTYTKEQIAHWQGGQTAFQLACSLDGAWFWTPDQKIYHGPFRTKHRAMKAWKAQAPNVAGR